MRELLSQNSMLPFKAGTVRNPMRPSRPVGLVGSHICLEYPSRINAMAVDPSKVAISCGGCYTPGEVLMAIDMPIRVDITISEGTGLNANTNRIALVSHVKGLMESAFGRPFAMTVNVSGQEIAHCGFGSSGRLLASLAAGINALFGTPFSMAELQQYMARNHGEEIAESETMLVPVQCIGGALSSGLNKGGFQIIAGESRLIAAKQVPSSLKIVIGRPDFVPFKDSKQAMVAELANMEKFYRIGSEHGREIAYRIVHEMLPALYSDDYAGVGNVIEWYRYDLGSNEACSFSHPQMMDWANELRANKSRLGVLMCGISSVGPALYAVTEDPESARDFLQKMGLITDVVGFWNDRFRVLEMG